MVEVKGRVVGPDGKPVAGAAVPGGLRRSATPSPAGGDQRAGRPVPHPPAQADRDGSAGAGDLACYPWLVASAPGFGLGLGRAGLASPTARPSRW